MRMLFLALGAALIASSGAEAREHYHHEYYSNRAGHHVHAPMVARRAPAGASARCRDGTYSFSENHRGTCSWHGGVAAWLR